MPPEDPTGGYGPPPEEKAPEAPKTMTIEEAMQVRGMYQGHILKEIDHWFTYHPPRPDQLLRFCAVRDAAKAFALVIAENCLPTPDRSAAFRLVREAVMTANACIALERE